MQAIRVVYTKRVSLQTKNSRATFSNLGAKEILEEEERGQGAMPLEVGGALRLRLEARISRQLAADSRQHKDGGQRDCGCGT